MEIKDIWMNFSLRISEIDMVKRSAHSMFNKTLDEIFDNYNTSKGNAESEEEYVSFHNMAFRSPYNGDDIFYDSKRKTKNKIATDIIYYKNKQYQWLLAEAYEEFEDFLEHAYAFYGKKFKNFWPLEEYGNITLSEITEKDFYCHLERAKNKNVKRITNTFRKEFSQLKTIEETNFSEINSRMAIILIEKFRHLIVHNGGKTSEREKLIEKVMKESEAYKNGNIQAKYLDFANSFFSETNSQVSIVTLLEINNEEGQSYNIYFDVYHGLIKCLLSYAYIIYSLIDPSIRNNNSLTLELYC